MVRLYHVASVIENYDASVIGSDSQAFHGAHWLALHEVFQFNS
jgi:hypothetical protein